MFWETHRTVRMLPKEFYDAHDADLCVCVALLILFFQDVSQYVCADGFESQNPYLNKLKIAKSNQQISTHKDQEEHKFIFVHEICQSFSAKKSVPQTIAAFKEIFHGTQQKGRMRNCANKLSDLQALFNENIAFCLPRVEKQISFGLAMRGHGTP